MTNKKELGDDLCKYCPLEKKGVYVVAGGPFAGCEGSRCDEAYENYENLVSQKLEPMTNLEAIGILTRHNVWRRDNETEFPELPDSPALIGEAIDVAIKALRDLGEAKDWLKGSTFLIHSDGWKKDIDILLKKLE